MSSYITFDHETFYHKFNPSSTPTYNAETLQLFSYSSTSPDDYYVTYSNQL